MDKAKTKYVIVLSIKPIYAHAILSGKKTVEFRKNGIPTDIKRIVLYSSQPEQKIVGFFDVANCEIDHPSVLWEKYRNRGFIDFDGFHEYYRDKKIGKCFIVSKTFQFKNPVPLEQCKSFSTPPPNLLPIFLNQNGKI